MNQNNESQAVQVAWCNACGGFRNHFLLNNFIRKMPLSESNQSWDFLVCNSCQHTQIKHTDNGHYPIYYPQSEAFNYNRKFFSNIPEHLEAIYTQVVHGYDNNQALLCAAGLRSLVEGICSDVGNKTDQNRTRKTSGDLYTKIKSLSDYLQQETIDDLQSLRILGNSAVHDLFMPQLTQIYSGLKTIEKVLNDVYEGTNDNDADQTTTTIKQQLLRNRKEAIWKVQSLHQLKPIFIEIETSGIDPNHDEILQILAIDYFGKIIFDRYIKSKIYHIHPFISKLTGITQDQIDKAPIIESVLPDLLKLLHSHTIIAWNVGFDRDFFAAAICRNKKNERLDVLRKMTDLMEIAMDYSGWVLQHEVPSSNISLRDATRKFGIDMPDKPTNIDYCYMLRDIFKMIYTGNP